MIFKRAKKEQNKQYRLIKSVDGAEKYTLYNAFNEPVFYAENLEKIENGYKFHFNDLVKHKESDHEITRRYVKTVGGKEMLSFKIDGVDIWQRLKQIDIDIRVTVISDTVTEFHIIQGEYEFARAIMEKKADKTKTIYIMKDVDNNTVLFFVFFAVAKLY